jgi:pimeloyl-ACP methyl ester carboxylesterase
MTVPEPIALTTADGVRLAATYWRGDGSTTVGYLVLHGFTGSSRSGDVRRIGAQLAATGAAVLAPDLRGHGRSGGRRTVGNLEVHDAAAGVAQLRADGYRHVVVVGWSMGGSVALRHAGLGGDADAVVSVSSPGVWFERGTRPMRVVHWLCETRTGRLLTRFVRGTRLAGDGWPDVPESPEQVAGRIAPTPLLIVHGDRDHYFPLRHVDLLAAAAPTATLWIEAGMAHAESATSPELVDRIDAWARSVITRERVWEHGSRD